MLICQSARGWRGKEGGREGGKGKVQELGNCPFEGTADDCTELNQGIERGENAKKRGVCVAGRKITLVW